jgi:plasmid stabilization system protein ParE
MRQFAVLWDPRASLDVLSARTLLGPVRAAALDEELELLATRLAVLPEMGAPVKTRKEWSLVVRRLVLTRSPYHLYYRLSLVAERVVLFALWHENRRPPRLSEGPR